MTGLVRRAEVGEGGLGDEVRAEDGLADNLVDEQGVRRVEAAAAGVPTGSFDLAKLRGKTKPVAAMVKHV